MISGCDSTAKEVSNAPTNNNNNVQAGISMNQNRSIQIQIDNKTFNATLEDNPTVEAFIKKLPLDVELEELNGNEKFYRFNDGFPTSDTKPDIIRTGDLMLYSSSYFVIFYKDFATSYSYTRLGKIEEVEGLVEALGENNIRVKINF